MKCNITKSVQKKEHMHSLGKMEQEIAKMNQIAKNFEWEELESDLE